MKKIFCLLFATFLLGCSNTPYENLAINGYRVSAVDSRFLSKNGDELSHYKYNDKDASVYLIIEKNEATEDAKAFLNFEYTGKDWLYIEKAKLIGGDNELEIDFLSSKFSGALSQEIPKASGSVKERILMPLTDEQVNKLEEVLASSVTTKVLYSSRYRNGESEVSLSPKDKKGLKTMIKLYNKVKGEKVNGN